MFSPAAKIGLTLKPLTENFAFIPVMIVLQVRADLSYRLAARYCVFDLKMVATLVIWVESEQIESYQNTLADLDMITEQVTKERAQHIAIANKPLRGEVKLQIRTRGQMNEQMVRD